MKYRRIPPSYFNLMIILAVGLHYILPIRQLIYPPLTYIGLLIGALGLFFNLWSIRFLKRKNSSIEFNDTPQGLVVDGPYRISRNPIYLSGVIVLSGVAVFLGSLITFIFPIALVVILNKFYIHIEEHQLEELFGDEYLEYKTSVRRWI